MRCSIILILIICLSFSANAEESLYEKIAELSIFQEAYHVVPTQTGIDIKSKQTFENSKRKVEPVTHMELEGPFQNNGFKSLEHGIDFLANLVRQEVDVTYPVENPLYPGLGVVIIDVNGSNVGMLKYKMNREPDTYVHRAVLFSAKGLYSYSLTMHQSKPKSKVGLNLMAVVIASVNSGNL